jgi:hypothetical protein
LNLVCNEGACKTLATQDIFGRAGALSGVTVELRLRPDFVGTEAPPTRRVDAGKPRREMGRSPSISLEQVLCDMLEYWERQRG